MFVSRSVSVSVGRCAISDQQRQNAQICWELRGLAAVCMGTLVFILETACLLSQCSYACYEHDNKRGIGSWTHADLFLFSGPILSFNRRTKQPVS